ncbi:MAG: hypothetical protein PF505_05990 [Vallitaleaceae bacterium]|jgi:hypothetical protein|nr:hypothetical protein [Vallitaleaceae bacterium]
MKKRGLSILLVVSLLITLIAPTSVSAATYQQVADEATDICEAIGMVVGTGSGLTPAYLAGAPKRYGGAKLIVALRGYLDTSLVYPFTSNFTDYMDLTWVQGRNILGYLKENPAIGYNGKPDGSFAPNDNMTDKEYYKLMLVSLGYTENADFSWSGSATMPDVMELATSAGLVWLDEGEAFTMEKLCVATVEALKAKRKGSTDTLAKWLVDQGAIDPAVAAAYNLASPSLTAVASAYLNYEIALVNGETVISIQLTNGNFVSTLGANNALTQLLIDGIDGNLNTVVSYDGAVSLGYQNVSRLSDTLVTISIPASPTYRIATDETLTISIDPSLIQEAPTSALTTSVTISDVGSGTIDHPWQIYRAPDFAMMNQEPDDQYSIMADIDFDSEPLTPITRFSGILYGNNRKLSNVSLLGATQSTIGFFLELDDGAAISNLYIENATMSGPDSTASAVGILAGTSGDVTLTNVNIIDGTVSSASMIGGLIGIVGGQTTITSSQVDGLAIQTSEHVGGFVGSVAPAGDLVVDNSSITDFVSTASHSLGGIVGLHRGDATISDTTASVDLTGTAILFVSSTDIGGIVGSVYGSASISDCSSYGKLTGYFDVGGIIGYSEGSLNLDSNYGGIGTYTYKPLLIDDITTATFHRVIGNNAGLAVMDNTGLTSAKLIHNADGLDYAHWVSDATGIDGLDKLLFLIPDFFIIIPTPIIPGPVLPDLIWELEPLFP